ncbi:MAG: YbhB/YbcL family Raf kinase inhibitor-like protein [Rickettsia endosymbiont of Ixodes persulcatus]|nr:YbhB/YbcL family Raf kinase inhibitor-like protein [Rickettsia endosymbiont of Ixodes persulcatus]MCZ6908768.1 YbhB/YbcL family Raf kinase inhibitor-like protein [Rickettsia endosymbiont of Ixodes persulcatus]MCZ6911110.1 YbhB/YbcL family Raf kinase inhibitor-like protein [Rickettsia endosymbiont of Ixodes persulcatus]MCZ6914864.1 YbhB/YbcL family Raf kinase inhibitor-like protein [Rickettsia endosymbiont of Ixodes persulcatus]MCZ6924359.1 YbhB/YbcL family Raf kinase inhibitor-like protein [
MTFIRTSTVFKHNDRIPGKFTCKGQNVLLHLEWNNAPSDTKSFALIMDDPDAPVEIAPPHGIWDHWIIYNIPASITELSEGKIDSNIKILNNSWKEKKYGAPCLSAGKPHRYFFKLYALNDYLALDENTSKQDLVLALQKHLLSKVELIGIYSIDK